VYWLSGGSLHRFGNWGLVVGGFSLFRYFATSLLNFRAKIGNPYESEGWGMECQEF
jgi:hypothetical protein